MRTGFVRKAIKPFRKKHAKYASFELLCEMYQRIWEADPSRYGVPPSGCVAGHR